MPGGGTPTGQPSVTGTGGGTPGPVGDGASFEAPDLGVPDLEIRREVARGGFGVVYEGRQTALNRTVAVKLILAQVKDEKVRIRFERECKAMGLLSDHPHIVTVFDAGFGSGGQPWILMDFMTGGSLADRVERDGPMGWADVVAISVKLASALETAHRSGVLHRDMKPENVLLSSYGEPELGDFGIARLAGGPETRTDTLTASIAHVAPELLAGEPPSVSTDLYALGSTMYVLLSGRSAFLRDTDESIVPALSRITSDPVPDLRPLGVHPEVVAVVERLMAKDPAQRFATALELGVHLQAVQRRLGLPVTPVHVPGVPAFPEAGEAGTGPVDLATALDQTVGGLAPEPAAGAGAAGATLGGSTGPAAPPGVGTGQAGPPGVTTGPAGPPGSTTGPGAPPADTGAAAPPPLVGGTGQAAPPALPGSAGAETTPVRIEQKRRSKAVPILAAVALLAVAVVVGALILTRGGDEVAGPGEQPTGAPDGQGTGEDGQQGGAEPQATPTEAPGGGDTAATVQRTAEQLAEVRGLPLLANIDAQILTTADYGTRVRDYADTAPVADPDHGRVLAALRLIPPDIDYPETIRRLWEEQFYGIYDESSGEVLVRSDSATLSAYTRKILADEVMVAILDQSFDLAALFDRADDRDAERAARAFAIGDTFLSSTVWFNRFLTAEERAQADADEQLRPDTFARSVPQAILAEFIFPFETGPEFVRAIFAEGSTDALNAVYEDPPTTTEQVIYPERYLAREPAVPVEVASAPEAGWTELTRRTFGTFDLEQLFNQLEPEQGFGAAEGWGGGQLVAWEQGEQLAVAVWLEMDTPEDGAEACEAVPLWYVLSGGVENADGTFTSDRDAMALRCDGQTVRFAVAPDAGLAQSLLG
jgi:predicted Ser/Thr protein kinase